MKFAFVPAEKAYFPIAFMCRHLRRVHQAGSTRRPFD